MRQPVIQKNGGWAPRVGAWVLILSALVSPSVAAQEPGYEVVEPGRDHYFAALSANAVIGAGMAGMRAWIEGNDVGDAVLRGALGGGVGWMGKWLATEWDAAPIAGRTVASVGNEVVRRASGPGPWIQSVVLPLGPAHLVVPMDGRRPRLRLSLADVGVLAWALAQPELETDWSRSLAAGAPVFVANDHAIRIDGELYDGFQWGGVIVMETHPPDADRIFRHEVVHLVQHDFAGELLWRPSERWLLDRTPLGPILPSWLELGLLELGTARLSTHLFGTGNHLGGLLEQEARWFAGR